MPRKSKKSKVAAPEKPGRLIKGYGEGGSHDFEEVEIALDDAKVREYGERIKELDTKRSKKADEATALKQELTGIRREIDELTHAVVYRVHSDRRSVWKYADDEAGMVSLYDRESGELLQTRPWDVWERQEEMDLDGEGNAEEAGDGDED